MKDHHFFHRGNAPVVLTAFLIETMVQLLVFATLNRHFSKLFGHEMPRVTFTEYGMFLSFQNFGTICSLLNGIHL